MRDAHIILVGKHQGKILFGRCRNRWKGNIKMDLREVGCNMNWIQLAQDAV
jgi:hypothetical protein